MLPERFGDVVETGEIKNFADTHKTIKRRSANPQRQGQRPRALFAALSICLSLAVLATLAAELVTSRAELAKKVTRLILMANFPIVSAPPDIQVSLPITIPDSDDETVPTAPDETAGPPETAVTPVTTTQAEEVISPTPDGALPIVSIDLSAPELGEFYISNETPYTPDIEYLSRGRGAVAAWSDLSQSEGPIVLILHTHATEAYSPDGAAYYDEGSIAPRSENPAENVIAVGSVMASVFRKNGIPTLHCTILHDKESYKDSYNRAAATIKDYLAKYPSIKYVFDVHRDSLIRENGDKLRPVVDIGGESIAQVMSVVGTDYKGAPHASWETNLSLAAVLQSKLNENHLGLARHIYLRGASFNQQYTQGSLLLEIGSCGNSLDEAKRAGRIVAEALSQIIKGS